MAIFPNIDPFYDPNSWLTTLPFLTILLIIAILSYLLGRILEYLKPMEA